MNVGNVSKALFDTDETLVGESDDYMKAAINQSRIADYYKYNATYPVLMFSNQFGLPVMGGPITNSSGYPGAIIPKDKMPKVGYALYDGKYTKVETPKENRQPKPIQYQGIYFPQDLGRI